MSAVKKLLRSRRGASYLIVLAVTAFLLLLAAAALTAASSAGASAADRNEKAAAMLADSVSDNFMYSLQSAGEPLGPGIVKALYDSQYPESGAPATPSWTVAVALSGVELPEGVAVGDMTLSFSELSVSYTSAVAGRAEVLDEGGALVSPAIEAKAAAASVSATMTAKYTITYLGRAFPVTDTYSFSSGGLSDTGTTEAPAMTVTKNGVWRLMTHETGE